jgi:hypothetical protein
MSAAGVFKILTNDGKADQMLMATQLLKDRICEIIRIRESHNYTAVDTLPTLKDIEYTHVLHFQSKFKPFVALGYEYQNVKQQSGTQTFGGVVQFNIPQFGDFLTDTVLNTVFSSCSFAATVLPSASSVLGNTGVPDSILNNFHSYLNEIITLPDGSTVNSLESTTFGISNGISVPAVNVRRLRGSRFVDEDNKTISSTSLVQDNIYYCDYPGERLLINTKFEVNGNPLDEYDHMSYTYYRKYRLCKDKEISYNRNMGQENKIYAYTNNITYGVRQQDILLNGPQTPKQIQPQLTMWIKLLFWFNLDHSQALVSAAIPSGQRYITFTLANVTDMVFRAPSVWYEAVLITDIFIQSPEINNIIGEDILLTNGVVIEGENFLLNGIFHSIGRGGESYNSWCLGSYSQLLRYPVLTNGAMVAPVLQSMNLYVNNIFTIPEIHDIYIERIGFSLIRVHRRHQAGVNVSSYELLMSNFKYPVEFFYCGLRPDINFTGPNRDVDWHSFMSNSRQQILGTSCNSSLVGARNIFRSSLITIPTTETDNTRLDDSNKPFYIGGNDSYSIQTLGEATYDTQIGNVKTFPHQCTLMLPSRNYYSESWNLQVANSSTRTVINSVKTIDTIGVQAHGINLYNDFDSSFFNSYIPEVYGGGPGSQVLTSSSDQGLLFINFCLHPYENQPSGHVNTSRAREFYVRFTSSVINSTNTATFLAEAQALNFLLVSDGSAVLRYTT